MAHSKRDCAGVNQAGLAATNTAGDFSRNRNRLGTAPAVFGAGVLSAEFRRLSVARGLHTAAGWLLLVFGALTIYGPLNPAHH